METAAKLLTLRLTPCGKNKRTGKMSLKIGESYAIMHFIMYQKTDLYKNLLNLFVISASFTIISANSGLKVISSL